MDLDNKCRLCMLEFELNLESEPDVNTYKKIDEDVKNLISFCLGIEADPKHSAMPTNICGTCYDSVEKFGDFKKKCHIVDSELKSLLKISVSEDDLSKSLQEHITDEDNNEVVKLGENENVDSSCIVNEEETNSNEIVNEERCDDDSNTSKSLEARKSPSQRLIPKLKLKISRLLKEKKERSRHRGMSNGCHSNRKANHKYKSMYHISNVKKCEIETVEKLTEEKKVEETDEIENESQIGLNGSAVETEEQTNDQSETNAGDSEDSDLSESDEDDRNTQHTESEIEDLIQETKKRKVKVSLEKLENSPLSNVFNELKKKYDDSSVSDDIKNNKKYQCSICEETFSRQVTKESHEKEHQVLYNCVNCFDSFTTHLKLLKHKAEVHKEDPFFCSFCLTSCADIHSWTSHMSANHVRCSRCKSYFKDQDDIKTHACLDSTSLSNDTNRIQYDVPGAKKGRKPDSLLPKKRGRKPKIVLDDSGKPKKNYYMLKKHKLEKQANSGNKESSDCPTGETSEIVDEDKKGFVCVHCNESFVEKGALICHQAAMHPGQTLTQKEKSIEKKQVFVCSFCLTFFNNSEEKINHVCLNKTETTVERISSSGNKKVDVTVTTASTPLLPVTSTAAVSVTETNASSTSNPLSQFNIPPGIIMVRKNVSKKPNFVPKPTTTPSTSTTSSVVNIPAQPQQTSRTQVKQVPPAAETIANLERKYSNLPPRPEYQVVRPRNLPPDLNRLFTQQPRFNHHPQQHQLHPNFNMMGFQPIHPPWMRPSPPRTQNEMLLAAAAAAAQAKHYQQIQSQNRHFMQHRPPPPSHIPPPPPLKDFRQSFLQQQQPQPPVPPPRQQHLPPPTSVKREPGEYIENEEYYGQAPGERMHEVQQPSPSVPIKPEKLEIFDKPYIKPEPGEYIESMDQGQVDFKAVNPSILETFGLRHDTSL